MTDRDRQSVIEKRQINVMLIDTGIPGDAVHPFMAHVRGRTAKGFYDFIVPEEALVHTSADSAPQRTMEEAANYGEVQRLQTLLSDQREDIRRVIYPEGWGFGKSWAEMLGRLNEKLADALNARQVNPELSAEEIADIQEGLADVAAGRVRPLKEIRAELNARQVSQPAGEAELKCIHGVPVGHELHCSVCGPLKQVAARAADAGEVRRLRGVLNEVINECDRTNGADVLRIRNICRRALAAPASQAEKEYCNDLHGDVRCSLQKGHAGNHYCGVAGYWERREA